MRTAAFLVLCLAGCSRSVVVPFPTKGAAPSTAEEVVVAKWILDHADDPGSVEFAKWGPNAKPGEYKTLGGGTIWDADFKMAANEHPIVRVVYREQNKKGIVELYDRLFEFDKNVVQGHDPNTAGDQWVTFWPTWVDKAKALGKN